MKILNRLALMVQPSRPKVIEGKKKGNYQKQCGCSNSSLTSMLIMMSTFSSMMGFACFISNLINSMKQDSIKQAYPSSIRHQLYSLIGFGLFIIIMGIVQIYLQQQRKSKYYLTSQVTMIPVAITMIVLSSIFYDRLYHSIETDFTQKECEKRVKRVFAQDEQFFQYYENVYNQFCSGNCPCSLSDQQALQINKEVQQGINETWEQCPNSVKIQNNETYNELLEQLEHHYNCAGLCQKHEYFSFRKVNSSLPKRSCIISVTEEFNLIAESTIAINVICSILMLFFSMLFLIIHKKIFYIWSYKQLKQKARSKLSADAQQNKNVNQGSPQTSYQQQYFKQNQGNNTSPKSQLNTSNPSIKSSPDTQDLFQSQKLVNSEITRQDVCDQKEECERTERLVYDIKQRIEQIQQSQNETIIATYQIELEEAQRMNQSAQRYYQSIIKQFQQQNIQASNQSSNADLFMQFDKQSNNQYLNTNEQVVIEIPVSDQNQKNLIKNPNNLAISESSPKSFEKQKHFPKTELQVIEEEMRQFDSVS